MRTTERKCLDLLNVAYLLKMRNAGWEVMGQMEPFLDCREGEIFTLICGRMGLEPILFQSSFSVNDLERVEPHIDHFKNALRDAFRIIQEHITKVNKAHGAL